tara:strand:- start:5826 stop:5984 length:159 start_codon:yes stop_codon:yes gene_type:complete
MFFKSGAGELSRVIRRKSVKIVTPETFAVVRVSVKLSCNGHTIHSFDYKILI